MAGVITTGTHPQLLWPGIVILHGESYKEQPLVCNKLFETRTSTKAYERVQELTGLGLLVTKSEGTGTTYDSDGQGYMTTFTHVAYSLGVQITREAIDDNQYQDVAARKVRKLAWSARRTKETVSANIFNRAFNSSYPGGDNVELCSTAHPTVSGTQANEPTVALDLNEAAIEDMLTDIMQMKDSRGSLIGAQATNLLVPPALFFEAQRILGSTLQSGTANNDPNVLRSTGMLTTGDIVVWPYLTDTDAWFVTTNIPDGLIMFERNPIEVSRDNDFDTDNQKIKNYMRFSVGWADWRRVRGSPGV